MIPVGSMIEYFWGDQYLVKGITIGNRYKTSSRHDWYMVPVFLFGIGEYTVHEKELRVISKG